MRNNFRNLLLNHFGIVGLAGQTAIRGLGPNVAGKVETRVLEEYG